MTLALVKSVPGPVTMNGDETLHIMYILVKH